MEHLASAEEYSELHLMSLFEKFVGVLQLGVQIVLVGFRSQADFLEGHTVLMAFLSSVTYLPFLLVKILAIIHYAAYWRVGVWRDFNKVESRVLGTSQCLVSFNYPHLIVLFVDETNLFGLNTTIYS